MNAKWYEIIMQIFHAVPASVWKNDEAELMLTHICDAQVEALEEGTIMVEIQTNCVGGDEPGMLA